jgi:hypothetical protein
MAQFNIDAHLSNGKRLEWLALPDIGEHPLDVEVQVRQAAIKKFGAATFFNRWERQTVGGGYIKVFMYA